jgi:ribosomal-protein-alanine N-acetyltransferase
VEKQIITANLILRTPRIEEDLSALKAFDDRNKNHLAKWESTTDLKSDDDYLDRLSSWKNECHEGKSARFFIFTKENPHQFIGICNFTQICHGLFQACYLGYKIDHQYEGKGVMFEALQNCLQYVFEELRLHRVMANYMPINMRSGKLLNRLGFVFEGYAKNYLLINNRWEDHILTALSYEQWKRHRSAEKKLPIAKQTCLKFREACLSDLEAIIALLFDDQLGQMREDISSPLPNSYLEAFAKICSDPNNELIVAEVEQKIVGVMQITYLYHLTFQGSKIAHIEGVRIQKEHRKRGIGKKMFQWAFERIKNHGCQRIQLMSDKRRNEAHQFYEHLGFSATHEGLKLFFQ